MNIDFIFGERFNYHIDIEDANNEVKFDGDREVTRAVYLPRRDRVFINLNAAQWKEYYFLGEEYLIDGIIETIVHESVHKALQEVKSSGIIISSDGEERIAQLLAGQRYAVSENKNIYIFEDT